MLTRRITRLTALGIAMTLGWVIAPDAAAQSKDARSLSFDDFKKQTRKEYTSFRDSVKKDYETFRDSINQEYANFMRNPWTPTKAQPHIDAPLYKEKGPEIVPEEQNHMLVTNSKNIKLESVLPISWPGPQPRPFGEIKDVASNRKKKMILKFYGTPVMVRDTDLQKFRLKGNDNYSFADGWERLSESSTNSLINDCLSLRDSLALPDWGYVKLLDDISSKLAGAGTNEQRMLHGFLLNQSGYKVRFGYDDNKKLHVLFSSKGIVYNRPRYFLNNEHYYPYTSSETGNMYICNFSTPGEQSVNFGIDKSPNLLYSPATRREVKVVNYPELTFTLTPNKNLIDFFNDYPYATLDSSPLSLWTIHGNTPVSPEIKRELYPALREAVEGKGQYEALQMMLKVAQSFPYGYDDKIWGRDRAFWMEESWNYPESDCEDHAINFSHIVRDILGLDVCLMYYPGHLSACVALTDEQPAGDYVSFDGKRFLVCDPTYLYGNPGNTPQSCNNAQAVLIPLRHVD